MIEALQFMSEDLQNFAWMKKIVQRCTGIFFVGGIVRDAFLEKRSKDIDLVVEGMTIPEIKFQLAGEGKVDEVGESFKVLKFRPTGFRGEPFDIAVPRKDRKVGAGHKGIEATDAKTIEEDLRRRDFTINSIAFNIKEDIILDPFDGLADLRNKVLRATDADAFVEDPLRILRGIQFAARFDFGIEPGTMAMMRSNSHLISEISGERILEEFEKILSKSGNTQLAFDLLEETRLDLALFGTRMLRMDADRLDPLSFFHVLGKAGGVNPARFYLDSLKGNLKMGHALEMLERIESTPTDDESNLRVTIFKSIQRAPYVEFATVLGPQVKHILLLMNTQVIPKSPKDLKVTGNDVKRTLGVTGPDVGVAISAIRRAALMNEFDWRDRDESLEFLETLK